MKKQVDTLDATPHKRFILSIVSDYDLTRSMCELIDNSIDIWIKEGQNKKLKIKIDFDQFQKTILISDNAGGVAEKDLEYLISPGATTNKPDDFTIGIFGVGTKRAVIALSEDIKISTRKNDGKTYRIEFDKSWLLEDNWHLPYYEVDQIAEDTTQIELQKLLINIDEKIIEKLIENLSTIYSKFLVNDSFSIMINTKHIKPFNFDNWAYPPNYEPRRYYGIIKTNEGRIVNIEVVAGLTTESSPATGEYGVYFYCNDRLIVSALKSPEVGFIKGIAGQPHPSLSIARIIVSLKGAAIDMPWNSSKSNINTNHYIFSAFRIWLLEVVKNYCSLARRLEGSWPTDVFQYTSGKIKDISISDFSSVPKAYLVVMPPTNIRFVDKIKQKNLLIEKTKPWTKGLTEGIVAVDYLLRQRLVTKNRIALILLDSTLEIAFKEYLVYGTGEPYTDEKLLNLFKVRHNVENEIKKYPIANCIDNEEWNRIKYYYNLRCKLVHEKASVTIIEKDIQDYREIVEKILSNFFELKF